MNKAQRLALLTFLDTELLNEGSWCGETHIQKAAYLLQELLGVRTAYDFILYKHGPFSFELRDDLVSLEADGFLELTVRDPRYGPSYIPTKFGETFIERFQKIVQRYREQVRFVAAELGGMGVADLEKMATALFITRRSGSTSLEARAEELNFIKPHISLIEAKQAVTAIDRLLRRSHLLAVTAEAES